MKLYLCDVNTKCGGGREALSDGMFRVAASDYLGADCGEEALCTAVGSHGKPYFTEPPLFGKIFFSLSHSGAYWAVVFHNAEVGLDIEDLSIRTGMARERMEKIAARFFSEEEAKYLEEKRGAENGKDLAEFFCVWTAKEAFIKYMGDGMSYGLSRFSVFDPPGGVTITTFSPVQGLICSCCSESENKPEVVVWDHGPDSSRNPTQRGG
jgi:4'-phosphopantetheinyl transferase